MQVHFWIDISRFLFAQGNGSVLVCAGAMRLPHGGLFVWKRVLLMELFAR